MGEERATNKKLEREKEKGVNGQLFLDVIE